jgi:hypothetical protein
MSELSRDALSLIEEARASDDPSAGDRERMRQKLSGQLGAAAFAGAVVASASVASSATSTAAALSTSAPGAGSAALGSTVKGGTLFGFGKLAVAAALASVLGTAGFLALTREPAATSRSAQPAINEAVSTQPVTRVDPQPTVQALPSVERREPAPQESAPQAQVTRPAPRKRAPLAQAAVEATTKPVPMAAPDLKAELELIARAQLALRKGQTDQALSVLREHEARFASGALREERLGLTALARCSGQGDAQAVLREFEASAPSSPMLRRVREACSPK